MTVFADTILHNATVYPEAVDDTQDKAIAIRQDKVVGLGTREQLDGLAGLGTKWENMNGKTILPGLTDAHIHLSGLANAMAAVECQTETAEECLQRLVERIRDVSKDVWITGHGWDQNVWGTWPTRQMLDQIAPENPVYLTARSLHAAAANSIALRLAGVTDQTPDPKDGEFQRTESGKLTGVLLEGAMRLVSDVIPPPPIELLAERLQAAQRALWRVGLVGVHDFDGADCFSALQLLRARRQLGLRVLKHLRSNYLAQAIELGLRPAFGDDWLKLGNVKLFSDGALGPRTAAMIEPYDDDAGNHGILLLEEEEIVAIGLQAAANGFSLAIHAIGDRANQVSLQSVARLDHELGQAELALPHRLEHLQLLADEQFKLVASTGVIASMQPVHALSDQNMAEAAWGSRNNNSYAWRRILDTGATLAFGSDAPVEDPNPFWGIHAAVTRTQRNSPAALAFTPDQQISLNQALRAYTLGPAIAAGWREKMGSLQPGHYADLIVLTQDPHRLEPADLFHLQPVGTMVAGQWRYRDFNGG